MPVRLLALFALAAVPAAAAAIDPGSAKPPAAAVKPHPITVHGDTRTDNYFWLKDKKDPEVIKYLDAENAYTASVMKPTEKLQETLYKEFLSRIKQTDLAVPYLENGYWYYSKTQEGKQYSTHCRKKGSLDAAEEIILDVNELAKGQKFMSAFPAHVSDSGNFLIYTSDITGFREYYLSVKDLRTGKVVEDRFVKASGSAWAADDGTLFYVTEDHAKRPHKLWRHTVGQPQSKDVLVYEEKDELFRLGVRRTRDKKYLLRTSGSSTTTEEAYLDAATPAGTWAGILPRTTGTEYSADHRDGVFYVRTNAGGATNFKVVAVPVGAGSLKSAKEVRPHDPKVFVQGVAVFRDFLIVSEREAGVPQLRVLDKRDDSEHRITFPEPVYSAGLQQNPEFATPTVHLSYSSLVTPASVYDYDPKTKERKLLKRTEIPAGYDPEKYVSEWVMATAPDGVKVPVSLVYKKGLKKDGTAPCLLTGYGSYGASGGVFFSPTRLSLLDRGFVVAQGHIRGGSDLGRQWYDDGKLMKKKNTFTDFVACADFLVNEKYCARDRLAIQGGSAGGLLVGATINLRPDVAKAAVLQVPFVDVVTTMLDESLPLTVQEFLGWGNPKEKPAYEYMKSYCPYTNLAAKPYPAILVTTSLNDSQVLFHEPAKYVAKMRYLNPTGTTVFKCNMAGGHGGSSGRYDALKEQAFVMAFVMDQLGVKE